MSARPNRRHPLPTSAFGEILRENLQGKFGDNSEEVSAADETEASAVESSDSSEGSDNGAAADDDVAADDKSSDSSEGSDNGAAADDDVAADDNRSSDELTDSEA